MTRRTALIVGVIVVILVLAVCGVSIWLLLPGPSLSVQTGPLPGRPGAAINVVGAHFPANKEIYVGLAAPNVPPTAGTSFVSAASDQNGRFNVTFPFPTDPNWTQLSEVVIYAGTPAGDAVATTRLQLSSIAWLLASVPTSTPVPTATPLPTATATAVVPTETPEPIPIIILQPTSGTLGSTVVVIGRGWRANEALILSLLGSGTEINVGVTNADAQGSFATTILLPTNWGVPTATVLARNSDGTLQAAANFRVLLPVLTYSLTVISAGNGSITTIGTPAVINCRATCSASFRQSARVTLRATADTGYAFDGWSGACSGKENCVVTMDGDKGVTATFKQKVLTLNTSVVDVRRGTITRDPDQQTYTYGQVVTLTATPAEGWSFDGWSGACLGKNIRCQVTMNDNKSVQAIFGINLTVTRPSGGTIKSAPGDINCGSICSANFDPDTLVTLTAVPNTDYTFDHWSNVDVCLATSNPCIFNINVAQFITATFARKSYTLTLNKTGNGTVTKTPDKETYVYNDIVQVTATPGSGWTFAGWSGACSGLGACFVTMDDNKSVTAKFALNTYSLKITVAGAPGTVSIEPDRRDCSRTCSYDFGYNTVVTLTATPSLTTTIFSAWSGDLETSDNPLIITIDRNKTFTATFTTTTH